MNPDEALVSSASVGGKLFVVPFLASRGCLLPAPKMIFSRPMNGDSKRRLQITANVVDIKKCPKKK